MSDDLIVGDRFVIPAVELEYVTSRSSGPGGQHVNTTSSRVTVRWRLDESAVVSHAQRRRVRARLGNRISKDGFLAVSAEDRRSQQMNRELARERLAALLDEALVVPKRRRRTKPSRGAIQRRLTAKKRRGALKAGRREPPD